MSSDESSGNPATDPTAGQRQADAAAAADRRRSAPGPGTSRRPATVRRSAPLARIGMIVFTIGLLAIFADVILFASGHHDLPLWLNLTAMLAPVGLGVGLVGVVQENRRSSPALARRRADKAA